MSSIIPLLVVCNKGKPFCVCLLVLCIKEENVLLNTKVSKDEVVTAPAGNECAHAHVHTITSLRVHKLFNSYAWPLIICSHIKQTWCLTSTETVRLIRDGEKVGEGGMEVREGVDYILIATLSPPE